MSGIRNMEKAVRVGEMLLGCDLIRVLSLVNYLGRFGMAASHRGWKGRNIGKT